MRRRLTARALLENAAVFIGIAVLIALVANVISFATTRDRLPPSVRFGDVDVSSLTIDEAISKTVAALQGPVTLRHLDRQSEITPATIGFAPNEAVMRAQLDPLIARQQSWDRLPAFALRSPVSPTALALPYQYSDAQLKSVVGELAQRFDREPRPPSPDMAQGSVAPGADGAALNQAEATEAILAAMASSQSRVVDLPVDVVPLGAASVKALDDQIAARLREFTGQPGNVAGVFIKDLRTGEEFGINADLAFSARGWLALPVVLEALRAIDGPLRAPVREQLSAVAAGDARAADDVLRSLGDGDAQRGVDAVNELLGRLGLRSTFLAQPPGLAASPPTFVTPANSRADAATAPDPAAQATVAEVGVLLEMLAQCRDGTGALALALEGEVTPEECQAAIDIFSQANTPGLIQASSAGARATHRQSWDARNHGDAALVRSPGGEYVIAVQMHGGEDLQWPVTSAAISDIARLTYGFFNGAVPPPTPPLSGPP